MKRRKDATVLLLLQRWETGYGVTSLSLFEIYLLSLSPLTSGMVVPESTDGCFIVLGNPHHKCGPPMSVQKRWWLLGGKARASGMYKVQFDTLKLQILKPGNVRGNGSGIGRKGAFSMQQDMCGTPGPLLPFLLCSPQVDCFLRNTFFSIFTLIVPETPSPAHLSVMALCCLLTPHALWRTSHSAFQAYPAWRRGVWPTDVFLVLWAYHDFLDF